MQQRVSRSNCCACLVCFGGGLRRVWPAFIMPAIICKFFVFKLTNQKNECMHLTNQMRQRTVLLSVPVLFCFWPSIPPVPAKPNHKAVRVFCVLSILLPLTRLLFSAWSSPNGKCSDPCTFLWCSFCRRASYRRVAFGIGGSERRRMMMTPSEQEKKRTICLLSVCQQGRPAPKYTFPS